MNALRAVCCAVALFLQAGLTGKCLAQLRFERTEVTVPANGAEVLTAEFPFVVGPADVVIGEIKADCSCSLGTLEKHVYGPGEKGSIKFEFRVGDYAGPQDKRLYVVASDQSDPHVLTLFTSLPILADITPRTVYWDHNGPLTPKLITVTAGEGQPPVTSLQAASDNPGVTVAVQEIVPGRKFALSLTPAATGEVLVAKVNLRVNFEQKGERSFYCFAMVKPLPE